MRAQDPKLAQMRPMVGIGSLVHAKAKFSGERGGAAGQFCGSFSGNGGRGGQPPLPGQDKVRPGVALLQFHFLSIHL